MLRRIAPLLLLLATPALADDVADDAPRAELAERLRALQYTALTEALALDEATATRLAEYLRTGDEAVLAVHEDKRAARRALRRMSLDETWDEARADALLRQLADADVRIAQLRAQQLEGLRSILNARQRLEYLAVRQRVEEEVRRILRERRLR